VRKNDIYLQNSTSSTLLTLIILDIFSLPNIVNVIIFDVEFKAKPNGAKYKSSIHMDDKMDAIKNFVSVNYCNYFLIHK